MLSCHEPTMRKMFIDITDRCQRDAVVLLRCADILRRKSIQEIIFKMHVLLCVFSPGDLGCRRIVLFLLLVTFGLLCLILELDDIAL
jgi:hypothetical protein